jgi:3-oxoacyl-[acyl-carrier protein] reductase
MTDTELEGRTALVTGGSSDMGAATVRALAKRGANVVVHYHQNEEAAQSVVETVSALGRQSHVVQGDLASYEEVKRIAAEASAFAPIDILINNAGTLIRRVYWLDLEPELIERIFAINYHAPFYLCQQLVPGMIDRGKGVIINILSTAAHLGGSNTAFAYGAAKGALLTFTRGLAGDLAPKGVRVMAVSPGTIDTGFHRKYTSPEQLEEHRNGIPLGRIGRPEEIGEVVAFMATDHASFVVGPSLEVNGGLYMG